MSFPSSVYSMALIMSSATSWRREGLGFPYPPDPYPTLVPGFCFCFAATGNFIILGLDLGYDAIHIQLPAIVHLDNHRGL